MIKLLKDPGRVLSARHPARMRGGVCLLLILSLVVFPGCWVKGTGTAAPLGFKRITPRMEAEMLHYIQMGCDQEYQYLDPEVAQWYSFIPGGGQFYTGETGKAVIYILSSPLLIPYFVSFKDAQNSVDYYNFRYTLLYCREKIMWMKKEFPLKSVADPKKSAKATPKNVRKSPRRLLPAKKKTRSSSR
ncbi:MAG: hypothetical protein COV67_10185 [Nitrospinae bacterium CG11_big_fil_rev_8_21_14_0_20_56_8]|nr:MAG: hypothetical protein COV67_10185 [Nitrospinae bacterium CG11_big_fil_rev_8_21_14_0_20_56_8]